MEKINLLLKRFEITANFFYLLDLDPDDNLNADPNHCFFL